MATMELEAKKALLVRNILTDVNDMEFLKKLQKAFNRIKSQTKTEEEETEYISKEEILAGIRQGLQDVKEARNSGKYQNTLQEVIDELK